MPFVLLAGAVITSTANPLVRRCRRLAEDRRARAESRTLLLDGVRLLADALASGAVLEAALYAPEQLERTAVGVALLLQLAALPNAQPASPAVVAAASDTQHPQGVVAVVRWPALTPQPDGLTLVLDAIQDPGNLGTLLRSAEAAGVGQVLCARGTADLYAPKVLRAAMGAHFRLAAEQDLPWETVAERLRGVDHVYAADAAGALSYTAVSWFGSVALIVGNEAQGLSEAARALMTEPISIPMVGRAESLNAAVAGSIILFESLRQRMSKV